MANNRDTDNSPFDAEEELTAETLRRTWTVCTKVAHVLDQGSRLENLSWRLMFMELRRAKAASRAAQTQASGQAQKQAQEDSIVSSPSFEWPKVCHSLELPPKQKTQKYAKAASTAPSTRAPSPSAAAGFNLSSLGRPIAGTSSLADWITSSNAPPGQSPWNALFDQSNNTPPPANPPPSAEPVSDSQDGTPMAHGAGPDPLPANLGETMEAMFKSAPLFESESPENRQHQPPYDGVHAPVPAFASSYGHYQPVSGPYSRFLTPSPGPSLLENLDDLVGEYRSSRAASPRNALAEQQSRRDDPRSPENQLKHEVVLETIWSGFENQSNSSPESSHGPSTSSASGLTIGVHAHTFENGRPAFEIELARQGSMNDFYHPLQRRLPDHHHHHPHHQHHSSSNSNGQSGGAAYDNGLEPARSNSFSSNDSSPYGSDPAAPIASTSKLPSESNASAARKDAATGAARKKGKTGGEPPQRTGQGGPGVRKNRNPHATQLPGEGSRKQAQVEGGEGHQGPSCSHCASIVTPLWRRGPNDELLCNACGLYHKLHGKSRPIKFAKDRSTRTGRTNLGVAAQAAASGVAPSCHNCAATSTPMWRKDANGHLSCNACSLYFKLHNKHRPADLKARKKRKSKTSSLPDPAGDGDAAAQPGSRKSQRKAAPVAAVVEEVRAGSSVSPDSITGTLSPPSIQQSHLANHPAAQRPQQQQRQQQQQHLPPSFPSGWRASPRARRPADEEQAYDRMLKRPRIDESWERSTSPAASAGPTLQHHAHAPVTTTAMISPPIAHQHQPQPQQQSQSRPMVQLVPMPVGTSPPLQHSQHSGQQHQTSYYVGGPSASHLPALVPSQPPPPSSQQQQQHLQQQQHQQQHQQHQQQQQSIALPQQYAGLPLNAVAQGGYWYPSFAYVPPPMHHTTANQGGGPG